MAVPAPNLVWRGAHPNNFTVGRPGGGRDGQETFHHVVGSAESAVVKFNNGNAATSSHFVVTDQPGVIFQCVSLDDTAWTDSNWNSNLRAITVEHHGDWRNGYNNDVVRENSAWLLAWLRENFGVDHAVRHRDVASTGTICPADLPVEEIWARSDQIINDYNKPAEQPEWLKNRQPFNGKVYAQADNLFVRNLNDPSQPADSRRFAVNTSFDIGSVTTVGGKKYYITVSSTNANLPNGLSEDDYKDTPWSPPVIEPPVPNTPTWRDAVVDVDNHEMYVIRETLLINLDSGKPVVDKNGNEIRYKAGDIIKDISAHTIVSGDTYYLTEYSFSQAKAGKAQNSNGILANDLSLDTQSAPVGTPANPSPEQPEKPKEEKPVNNLKDRLLSRKFILALVAAFVGIGNSLFSWGLTDQQVWSVITPLLAFIGVEGAADLKSR